MAWIELHQGLGTHVKTRRLCKLLGIGPAQAVGHLALLWTWALDAAENGSLAKYQADDLALVCEWDGEATAFVAALERAGFLDLHHGELVIHDWQDYIGRLLEARERYKQMTNERVKRFRERQAEKRGNTDETRYESVGNGDETRYQRVSNADETHGNALTKPNLTKPIDTHVCSVTGTHGDLAATQATEKPAKAARYTADFEAFWKAYPGPRRKEKPDAFTAWQKVTRQYTVSQVMASLEAMKTSPDWTKQDGEFVPMPGRWLRRLDPDDVVGDQEQAKADDVPEQFRGKPWLFHFKQTNEKQSLDVRVALMGYPWGFDYEAFVALYTELGSLTKVADEMWRRHQEKEASRVAAN